jgi:serine/threonine protein kinase
MSAAASEHDPLNGLVEAFLEEVRQGRAPSVSEYARRHPALADQIHDLFPTLLTLERLSPDPPPAGARPPERLGEYRLLREVGRGGMGVVYEAVHTTLGRHVALKILPFNDLADPVHLERFRREAQAAARLHHTNIVPVFEVGAHDGIHFYAMQFIAGHSLEEVLEQVRRRAGQGRGADATTQTGAADGSSLTTRTQRDYHRGVARLGVQAAQALHHAHQHGILHRDVKPGNLLLDADGTVWVTDFGLAKADDGGTLTGTGDVVGTLRFMAPERFRGQADARSDVYSLGATLYELLTLRPTFDAPDRAALVERILHGEPAPPRRLDRHIPRDLETVVLKALAREPARRYATAADLARDLQRFLDDQPVRARRARPWERLARWAKRRPVVAGLLALLAAALVALAVLSHLHNQELQAGLDRVTQEQRETRKARDDMRDALALAEQNHTRAEENFAEALGAVDRLLSRVGDEKLRDVPQLEKVRAAIYEDALAALQRLLARKGADPETRHKVADAYARVAETRVDLGLVGGGEESFRQAVELFERLAAEYPGRAVYRKQLVTHLFYLGETLLQADKHRDSEATFRRGVELARQLGAEAPAAPGPRLRLAMNLTGHAQALVLQNRFAEAERDCTEADGLLAALDRELRATAHPFVTLCHATNANTLGRVFVDTGRFLEAEQQFAWSVLTLEQLAAAAPGNSNNRVQLAFACGNLGDVQALLGEFRAADEAFAAADRHYEKLAADFPGVPGHRKWQAFALFRHAAVDDCNPARLGTALAGVRRGIGLLEAALGDSPADLHAQERLGWQYLRLGMLLYNTGSPLGEVEKAYRQGAVIEERLTAAKPGDTVARLNLANFRGKIAQVCRAAGKQAEANWEYRAGLAAWDGLTPRELARRETRVTALEATFSLGIAAVALEDLPTARRFLARTVDGLAALPRGERPSWYSVRIKTGYKYLIQSLLQSGDHRLAADRSEELPRHFPDEYKEHMLAAGGLIGCVSWVERDKGLSEAQRREGGAAYADRAAALYRSGLRAAGDTPQHRQTFARSIRALPNFETLRQYPAFQTLLRELEGVVSSMGS